MLVDANYYYKSSTNPGLNIIRSRVLINMFKFMNPYFLNAMHSTTHKL